MKFMIRSFLLVFFVKFLTLTGNGQRNDVCTHLQSKITTFVDDAAMCEVLVKDLLQASLNYSKRCTTEAAIKCGSCKKRIMEYSEFSGNLVSILKTVAESTRDLTHIREIIEKMIKMISEKFYSNTEIENYMVATSNEFKFICSKCLSATWEKM